MALKLITAPTVPCVPLADAKLHLRVDVPDDDALITALVEAATQDAEHLMGRAIMPQQWKLTLDSFFVETRSSAVAYTTTMQWRPAQDVVSDCILLQRPIVQSVDSVKYIAASTGVQTTLPGTEWQADLTNDLVGRLAPAYGKTWPDVRAQMGAVEILFTCGWADAASVPSLIKRWILLRVGALYENREAWTLGKPIERNEFIDQLLDRYRIFTV